MDQIIGKLRQADVDALVSKSIVMVNIYRQKVTLGLTAKKDYERNYLEDITRNSCSGAASVKCRMRKCVKGRVSFIRQVNVGLAFGGTDPQAAGLEWMASRSWPWAATLG
jgi:hypothetical protein